MSMALIKIPVFREVAKCLRAVADVLSPPDAGRNTLPYPEVVQLRASTRQTVAGIVPSGLDILVQQEQVLLEHLRRHQYHPPYLCRSEI